MALSDFETNKFFQEWFIPLVMAEILGVFILVLEGFNLVNLGQVSNGLKLLFPGVVFTFMLLLYKIVMFSSTHESPETPYTKLIHDSGEQHSIMFFLGMITYTLIRKIGDINFLGSTISNAIELPTMSLLSTAQSQLTDAQYYFINGLMAPYIEEMFFFFAIGGSTYLLLKRLDLPEMFALVSSIVATAVSFAMFHVGSDPFTQFWIAAVVFSVLVRGISVLDLFFDTIPGVAVLISFAIGAHMANNILTLGGFVEFFSVISQTPITFVPTLIIFGSFGIWALKGLNEFIETGDVTG